MHLVYAGKPKIGVAICVWPVELLEGRYEVTFLVSFPSCIHHVFLDLEKLKSFLGCFSLLLLYCCRVNLTRFFICLSCSFWDPPKGKFCIFVFFMQTCKSMAGVMIRAHKCNACKRVAPFKPPLSLSLCIMHSETDATWLTNDLATQFSPTSSHCHAMLKK